MCEVKLQIQSFSVINLRGKALEISTQEVNDLG
jgi:hypothetical protein